MKAYKGFNRHEDGTLWCRDFQYEVGKTYTFDGYPILCERGFHACHKPWQCWAFYPNNGENVYYEVECGGKIVESLERDGKFVCTEITLVREIPAPENIFGYCSDFDFQDGFAVVKLDGKHNHINTDGKLLSKQWWDYSWHFCNGYAIVALEGKYNHINTDGRLLSEQWWDDCWDFKDGYAVVLLDAKNNYINTEGKLLFKQWFDYSWSFRDGYARVVLKDKWNYINTAGKYLFEQWWDWCGDFRNGYARVELKDKRYRIDKNGKIIQL